MRLFYNNSSGERAAFVRVQSIKLLFIVRNIMLNFFFTFYDNMSGEVQGKGTFCIYLDSCVSFALVCAYFTAQRVVLSGLQENDFKLIKMHVNKCFSHSKLLLEIEMMWSVLLNINLLL